MASAAARRSWRAAISARPAASSSCSDCTEPRKRTSVSASRTRSASASARLIAAVSCSAFARSRALARFGNILAQSGQIVLANGQFQAEACQFALRLLMLVRGADHFALGFVLFRGDGFERGFGFAKFGRDAIHLRLHFGHARFERNRLRRRARAVRASCRADRLRRVVRR